MCDQGSTILEEVNSFRIYLRFSFYITLIVEVLMSS